MLLLKILRRIPGVVGAGRSDLGSFLIDSEFTATTRGARVSLSSPESDVEEKAMDENKSDKQELNDKINQKQPSGEVKKNEELTDKDLEKASGGVMW